MVENACKVVRRVTGNRDKQRCNVFKFSLSFSKTTWHDSLLEDPLSAVDAGGKWEVLQTAALA